MRISSMAEHLKLFFRSKGIFILVLFLSAGVCLHAQSRLIEGTVTDSKGSPLEGVTVQLKGTSSGTTTDSKGKYSLSASTGSTLVFSYAGLLNKEEKVDARSVINVSMQENPSTLENVVVIGYGTQKKVNLSGAVSQVTGKELTNRPAANLTGALQGVLPGLTVLRGSGKPGSEGYDIRIRGFTSANDAKALVLVDGVEQDLNLIDPSDVESISVLKDASASAIYGARAAAGVILVTTKQGAPGKTRINLSSNYGINITARQPQRLDSWNEQLLIDEARLNATGAPEFNAEQYEWLKNPNFDWRPNPTQDRWDYYGNNNWIKEGMDKINHQQNHSLSVSGGEQKLNYLVSGAFFKRDGVLRYGPDDNTRTNLKVNVNADLGRYVSLKLTTGYINSLVRQNAFGTEQIINRLYRSRARQSLYTPPDDITGQPYNGDLQINAVDIEKNGGMEKRNYETFTGRLNLQVKNVIKGLTLDVIGWRNQNYYNMENDSRSLYWYGRTTNTVRFSVNVPNSITVQKNKAYQNNLQSYLTYKYKINKHNFTLMQGGSYEEYRKDEVTSSAKNMITNDFFSLNSFLPYCFLWFQCWTLIKNMKMKKLTNHILFLTAIFLLGSCNKLDLKPETQFSDADYWNTESDLMNAANRMYQQLDGNWIDNRADDNVNQNANTISNGSWTIPNTSSEWNDRYDEIFTANNILEKGVKAKVSDAIKNRYFGEARFFRAYAYLQLVQKYGDVPLVLHILDIGSPELTMPRTQRAEVMKAIYDDLDSAANWLPTRAALPTTQWGRVTKSAAWGMKARAALYEGTREKFRGEAGWQNHLQIALDAAQKVMGQGHTLFSNYGNLFTHAGEGPTNTEAIFIKIYGVSNSNVLLGHNNSRDLENGRIAVTRNLLHQYLYTDGLPAFNTDNTPSTTRSPLFVPEANETSYNTIFQNRDPRLTFTVFQANETAYKGPWVPTTSLGSRSAFATKKGFNLEDWTINSAATVDRILMRYAEILLIYAEAKYELNGSVSDADLNLTINALRTRAGLTVKLTNAFVATNNLDMREEIRRERTVELALEGFRYDDLIRWKIAEKVLPQELLGGKFIAADWVGTNPNTLRLNADNIVIAEPASTRKFQASKDYLYPVPLNEISLSGGNVTQNPNWQ